MLAVYDRSDPGVAKAIIVAGSDFEGTSPEVVLARDLVTPTTGGGAESKVDPDRSDEVGDTV